MGNQPLELLGGFLLKLSQGFRIHPEDPSQGTPLQQIGSSLQGPEASSGQPTPVASFGYLHLLKSPGKK